MHTWLFGRAAPQARWVRTKGGDHHERDENKFAKAAGIRRKKDADSLVALGDHVLLRCSGCRHRRKRRQREQHGDARAGRRLHPGHAHARRGQEQRHAVLQHPRHRILRVGLERLVHRGRRYRRKRQDGRRRLVVHGALQVLHHRRPEGWHDHREARQQGLRRHGCRLQCECEPPHVHAHV